MRPAYQSTRVTGTPETLETIAGVLQVGDELRGLASSDRLWLQSKSPIAFVGENPDERPTPSGTYMVYNTGAKNRLTSTAGGVVTWNQNPIATGDHITFEPTRVLNSSAVEFDDRGTGYCDSCSVVASRGGKNKFISGRRGNWKPVRNWFYLAERTPTDLPASNTDIRTQGLFAQYSDFWTINQGTSRFWHDPTRPDRWEWKEKVNLADTDGRTIETEDRIGRKVASLLGHRNTLVLAQAFNAGYSEALFDGFEDYIGNYCTVEKAVSGAVDIGTSASRRMRTTSGSLVLTISEAHTGRYSMQVNAPITFSVMPAMYCDTTVNGVYVPRTTRGGSTDSVRRRLAPATRIGIGPGSRAAESLRGRRPGSSSATAPPCNDCAGGFYPIANKTYLFSCWAKVDRPEPILSSSDATVEIRGMETVILHPEGPVIEGWQRVTGEFKTPHAVSTLAITLRKGAGTTWFDDMRIFPADGNMVSYVYDDVNLRLTYSLDENNYFTKNEYNNQGELIRVKRETERGVITIQEGNQSLVKGQ
jgi:hypothetical protein